MTSPPAKPSRTPAKKRRPAAKATRTASKRSQSASKPARKKPAKRPAKKPARKSPGRKKPDPKPPTATTNADAAGETIAALEHTKRLQPEHAAVVMLVRRLAVACDFSPDNATLWREYRQALSMLLGDPDPEHGGDHDGPSEMDELRRLLAE